jgi:hypothetical protein
MPSVNPAPACDNACPNAAAGGGTAAGLPVGVPGACGVSDPSPLVKFAGETFGTLPIPRGAPPRPGLAVGNCGIGGTWTVGETRRPFPGVLPAGAITAPPSGALSPDVAGRAGMPPGPGTTSPSGAPSPDVSGREGIPPGFGTTPPSGAPSADVSGRRTPAGRLTSVPDCGVFPFGSSAGAFPPACRQETGRNQRSFATRAWSS